MSGEGGSPPQNGIWGLAGWVWGFVGEDQADNVRRRWEYGEHFDFT